MKLTTITQVTVDGVMQGNGGASDEDRRNGFERGGWAMGMGDDETMTFINQTYGRADAFLFGRRTYELFAGFWGAEERARAAAEDPAEDARATIDRDLPPDAEEPIALEALFAAVAARRLALRQPPPEASPASPRRRTRKPKSEAPPDGALPAATRRRPRPPRALPAEET